MSGKCSWISSKSLQYSAFRSNIPLPYNYRAYLEMGPGDMQYMHIHSHYPQQIQTGWLNSLYLMKSKPFVRRPALHSVLHIRSSSRAHSIINGRTQIVFASVENERVPLCVRGNAANYIWKFRIRTAALGWQWIAGAFAKLQDEETDCHSIESELRTRMEDLILDEHCHFSRCRRYFFLLACGSASYTSHSKPIPIRISEPISPKCYLIYTNDKWM